MNIKHTTLGVLVGIGFSLSCGAQAALQGRDLNASADSFEAYYDTELNITWLTDTNVGGMDWVTATTWAADLSFSDGLNVYDNWRLPATLQPDMSCSQQLSGGASYGHNCTGSELGHLFYSEFGGTAGQIIFAGEDPMLGNTDPELAKFTNLWAGDYWSGTEDARDTYAAWSFSFVTGFQGSMIKGIDYRVMAVSDGDVAAVPEARTYALMLAGVALVGWRARRLKRPETRAPGVLLG